MPEKFEPQFCGEVNQAEKDNVESKESFETKINRALNLVSESAKEVLETEKIQKRTEKARKSIRVHDRDAYMGAYYDELRTTEGADDIPAFVKTRVGFYGDELSIGEIIIQKNELIEGKEASAILLHELTHKFGSEPFEKILLKEEI